MPWAIVRCADFVEIVTDWLEGIVSLDDRAQIEEHLVICPPCRDYAVQLQHSAEVLRETPRPAPPPAARQTLLDAFRAGTAAASD